MTHPVTRARRPRGRQLLLALLLALLAALGTAGLGGAGMGATAHAQQPTAPTTPAPTTPAQPGEESEQEGPTGSAGGSLRNAGEPLEGVTVRALDESGQEAASAESDARGVWRLTLPPGTYVIEVDEGSLPDGVSIQEATQSVTKTVTENRNTPVIFSFGEARDSGGGDFGGRLLATTVDGLRFGLVIAITAVGLSLIFGTTGLTNFAHGEMVTIGAIAAWAVNVKIGMHLVPATLIAIAVGVAVGALNELGIWRRLRRRGVGLVAQLVVSIGLAIALRALLLIIFSDRSESFGSFQRQQQMDFGPISITPLNLGVMLISLAVLVAVALTFKYTKIGKAMRAVSDNKDLAASSGINVDRVVLFVWCLGGGLAALGGVLFGLSELGGTVQFEMGFRLLLLMFAGITLGGLGTAYGALLGCVIVGLLVQWSTLFINPDLKYIGGLLVLIVILVLRPQGILGSRTRIG